MSARPGNGRGRGKGRIAARGVTWDRDGEDALYILKGYIAGDPKFADWEAFRSNHSNWLITGANPKGTYVTDNMRRNFREVLLRYHNHLDPNKAYDGAYSGFRAFLQLSLTRRFCCLFYFTFSSTGKYKGDFLEQAGAPPLPDNNPDGLNFVPGDDEGEYGPPAADEGYFEDLPPQVYFDDDDERGNNEKTPRAPTNPGIEQQIEQLTANLKEANMHESKNIVVKTFRCNGVKIKGFDRDDVTNVLGVVCFLGAGTVLNSLDIELAPDRQTVTAKGHCAGEMGKASLLLPAQHIFDNNMMIFEGLKQAVQTELNEMEVDNNNNPTFSGSAKLAAKAQGDVLPIHKLYLIGAITEEQKNRGMADDFWIFHKVPIMTHAAGTVPAYSAFCFFLEDQGIKKRSAKKNFLRLLPGLTTPQAASQSPRALNFPPSPQLPAPPVPETPRTKRRREDAEAAAAAAAAMQTTPTPDPSVSGSRFFGFRGGV